MRYFIWVHLWGGCDGVLGGGSGYMALKLEIKHLRIFRISRSMLIYVGCMNSVVFHQEIKLVCGFVMFIQE